MVQMLLASGYSGRCAGWNRKPGMLVAQGQEKVLGEGQEAIRYSGDVGVLVAVEAPECSCLQQHKTTMLCH